MLQWHDGTLHSTGKVLVPGNAQDGRAGAADAHGIAAVLIGQRLDAVILRDQTAAVGLVQPVLQRRGDQIFIALLDGPQQHRQIAAVAHGVAVGHHGGQYPTRFMGAEGEVRRQRHKPQLRMGQVVHRIHLAAQHHGGSQTAQQRRSQIVGMPLNLRGQGQQLPLVKGLTGHEIGRRRACGDQGRRGTQPPAHGNIGLNMDVHRRHVTAAQLLPHPGIGDIRQILLILILLLAAGKAQRLRRSEGQGVVQAQGTAQHIEAGCQIGGGGRHTDRYLFHAVSPAFFST